MGMLMALYGVALALLPPGFRREYGPAMKDEARLALEEVRGRGGIARVRAAARLGGDLFSTFLREWGSVLSPGGRESGALSDLRFAVRSFRRTPAFTTTVLVTLGLGIGANTAIFSVVDAVLLRPLPYEDSERLVAVWPGKLFSRRLIDETRDRLTSFDGIGAYSGSVFTVTEGGAPAELFGLEVMPGHFSLLGVRPALGRGFLPEDGRPGAAPIAVISHRLWRDRYGSDPDILGRSLELQSEGLARRTVVGVMPADYRSISDGSDVWTPVITDPSAEGYRNSSFMEAFGRLGTEVDRRTAHEELRALAARLHEDDAGFVSRREADRAGAVPLAYDLAGSFRFQLMALFGSVALVLLIACANVANLLLARTGSRTRELSLRSALGAGRRRLFAQLLTEGVVLGVAGGIIGVVFAWATRDVVLALMPEAVPDIRIDPRVLGFSAAVSIGAGLLFGMVPALHASRAESNPNAGSARAGSDRRSHRLQQTLMAAEVALAVVAVFAAGLLTRGARTMADVDPGFEAERVLTLRLTPPAAEYPTDDDVLTYFRDVREAIGGVPGVEAVGVVSRLPLGGGRSELSIFPEGFQPGPDGEIPGATHRLVSPGYAEAMGFRLREGRLLTDEDRTASEPYLGYVNASMVETHWPDGALGKSFLGPDGVTWLRVIGVVEDVRENGLLGPVKPAVYIPHPDWVWRTMSVTVRTALDPVSLTAQVEQAVWSVSPNVPVTRVRPMTRVVERSFDGLRITSRLFMVFGGLALLLGCVGVYGVVAHALGQRRREFGVRIALGASRSRVTARALGGAGVTLGIGVLAGALLTPVVGRSLSAAITGVGAGAPWVLTGTAFALLAVGLTAAWLPARRAASVDPVESLRAD